MNLESDIKKTSIISTSPSSGAGGSIIHMRILSLLVKSGFEVNFVGFKEPFLIEELIDSGIEFKYPKFNIEASSTISQCLNTIAITNEIYELAKKEYYRGKTIVLFSCFIFPFQQIISDASTFLKNDGIPHKRICHPTGSDVFAIGKKFPNQTKWLLDSSNTDLIVTYSKQFVEEIKSRFCLEREITVIPPPIDINKFIPLSEKAASEIKLKIGISKSDYVVINCSNMRYIKGLKHSFEIALKIASHVPNTTLLLVGHSTSELESAFSAYNINMKSKETPFKAIIGKLKVIFVGLQTDVKKFMGVSNLALNTSYHDSFNTSLLESLAIGLPILSSDVVGLREWIKDNDKFAYFFDYDSICEKVIDKKRTPNLSKSHFAGIINFVDHVNENKNVIKNQAISFVKNNFSDELIAKIWEQKILDLKPSSVTIKKKEKDSEYNASNPILVNV